MLGFVVVAFVTVLEQPVQPTGPITDHKYVNGMVVPLHVGAVKFDVGAMVKGEQPVPLGMVNPLGLLQDKGSITQTVLVAVSAAAHVFFWTSFMV
jgi:hypothetical protein